VEFCDYGSLVSQWLVTAVALRRFMVNVQESLLRDREDSSLRQPEGGDREELPFSGTCGLLGESAIDIFVIAILLVSRLISLIWLDTLPLGILFAILVSDAGFPGSATGQTRQDARRECISIFLPYVRLRLHAFGPIAERHAHTSSSQSRAM
jgi:hypothetical protein